MSKHTNIEWCDSTFNPWIGCSRVSPACDDCYAARSTPARTLGVAWGAGAPRHRTGDANWRQPLLWERDHIGFSLLRGRRRRVFCASLADVFDNEVPSEWRTDLFALVQATPHLDWLLLTKRIGNVRGMLPDGWGDGYPNVWIGATVVNQTEADRDIPKLLAVPAAKRFLSIEPMLGPVSMDCWPVYGEDEQPLLHWVIAGGESGPKARPAHPDWFRSIRDQCAAAGIPFLFKQWGEWAPDWEGAETCGNCGGTKFDRINTRGECGYCGGIDWGAARKPLDKPRRIGKKAAGRLLDGVEHDGFPS